VQAFSLHPIQSKEDSGVVTPATRYATTTNMKPKLGDPVKLIGATHMPWLPSAWADLFQPNTQTGT